MDEQIEQIVKKLKISYAAFWALPILIVIAGEADLFPVGVWGGDIQATYLFETLSILITALCVPLSLKLFSLVLTKKIDQMTIVLALKRYEQWSYIRLGLLAVAVFMNLACYYLTLSNTGNLCMLIALTASLFCMPGEKRLRSELHITKE